MSIYIKDLCDCLRGAPVPDKRGLLRHRNRSLYTRPESASALPGLREDEIGALVSMGILIMGVLAIPVSLLANRTGRKTAGYRRILYCRGQCAVCRQR